MLEIRWSHPSDSNRRPFDYESNALPTELGWLGGDGKELAGGAEIQNIRVAATECQVRLGAASRS